MHTRSLMFWRSKKSNPWKNIVFGLAGGTAGTIAMSYYWKSVSSVMGKDPPSEKVAHPAGRFADISVVKPKYNEEEASTAAMGRWIYRSILRHEPPPETTGKLSTAVHWTYGTLNGGLYSIFKRQTGIPEIPAALAYGAGMWAGSILAVPMLGLSKGPANYPMRQHLHSLAAHMTYMFTAAGVRRLLHALRG